MDDARNEKLLQAALGNAPRDFLECRDTRHLWRTGEEFSLVDESEDGKVFQRVLVCSRCNTRRVEKHLLRMDRWGLFRMHFVRSTYMYPEDYRIPEMARTDKAREILRAFRYAQLAG